MIAVALFVVAWVACSNYVLISQHDPMVDKGLSYVAFAALGPVALCGVVMFRITYPIKIELPEQRPWEVQPHDPRQAWLR